MAFNYPIHPPVLLKLPSTPSCTIEITQHTLLYGWNYPAHPPVLLKLPSTPSCTIEITQHTLLYYWNYPARPPVWLKLSNTPSCTVDIILHALKGQKLLAQGNALGINDIQLTPCKGKSFTYLRGFSFFIRCILKLLPLQGASLIAFIPRALPWAKSFCPFRACCCGLLDHQGVLLWTSWPSGRAAVGCLTIRACCCGLLDLQGVLLWASWPSGRAVVNFWGFARTWNLLTLKELSRKKRENDGNLRK